MTATFSMKKIFLRHLSLKLHNGQDKIALLLVKFNCSVLSSGKINCSVLSSGKISQKNLPAYLQIIHRKKFLVIFK